MAYNPFMNMNNPNGAFNPPYPNMRTPQQVQEDMQRQYQQYQDAYNQAVNAQSKMTANQFSMSNGFYGWKYADNDNEINNIQVPTNGDPFILIGNGVMWIKTFVNGQTYVKTYSFAPLVNTGEPPKVPAKDTSTTEDINNQDTDKNALETILSEIKGISSRVDSLETKLNDNPFKKVGNTNGKSTTNASSSKGN